jgi:hypothetical protein
MAVVYQHRRLDTNEIFYIGIGKKKNRPYSKTKRNNYWNAIVNKYGYSVEIIHTDITWEQSCEIEKMLILKYGRKDIGTGVLSNMTDGGDGGINPNDIIRKMYSDKMIGNNYRKGSTHTKETIEKIKNKRKLQIITEEHKKKISESGKGRILSEETRKKIGEKNTVSLKGRKLPKEVCEKMSNSKIGQLHWNYGLSNEIRNEIRKIYIPYNKEFGLRALSKRYNVCEQTMNRIVNHKK